MAKPNFTNLRVYQDSESLSDEIWNLVRGWSTLARDTVGKQLVRAADSIGANIAEGTGRGSYKDNRRFAKVARASLFETQHWLRRAYRRNLLTEAQIQRLQLLVEQLGPSLNAYVRSIGPQQQ